MLNIDMQLLTDEYNMIYFPGMTKVPDQMEILDQISPLS